MNNIRLFDINKYKKLLLNKVGIAIKIVYKYKGKHLFTVPIKIGISPFYSKNKQKDLEQIALDYSNYKEAPILEESIIISKLIPDTNNYLFLGINYFKDDCFLKFLCNELTGSYDNLSDSVILPYTNFVNTKKESMLVFYPIVIQINKDIRFAIEKLLNSIVSGCSAEEFPNCVEHFVKRYEIDFNDVFLDEEFLKKFIFNFIENSRHILWPGLGGFLNKTSKNTLVSYCLDTFSENVDKVKEWPLHNFDKEYLEDFHTKENLALIHYDFLDVEGVIFEYFPFQSFYNHCRRYYSNYFFFAFANYFGIKIK